MLRLTLLWLLWVSPKLLQSFVVPSFGGIVRNKWIKRWSSSSSSKSDEVVVLVDVENVRGKSKFHQTHDDFLSRCCSFAKTVGDNRTLTTFLVLDHGDAMTVQTGMDPRLVLLYSGTKHKADDVLIRLSQQMQNTSTSTVLVTSDNQIISSSSHNVLLDPNEYLQQLMNQTADLNVSSNVFWMQPEQTEEEDENALLSSGQLLQKEVALRHELQTIDRVLHPRKHKGGITPKKISKNQRTKLTSKRKRVREKLDAVLDRQVNALDSPNNKDRMMHVVEQTIMHKPQKQHATENNYERQWLAERLRRRLSQTRRIQTNEVKDWDELSACVGKIMKRTKNTHQRRMEQLQNRKEAKTTTASGEHLSNTIIRVPLRQSLNGTTMRVVVISDTHGFEDQFHQFLQDENVTASGVYRLPEADLLIHCGDFAGRNRGGLDHFLAAQTHIPAKVVVRGNHDPSSGSGRAIFPRSNALYATKPMTMTAGGLVIALRPHSRTSSTTLLPANCDVLVTHEPPFGILDDTYRRNHAGSMSLRSSVESTPHKPALWLCGHIHEGRGAVQHTFVSSRKAKKIQQDTPSTVVINAANANSGKANRLVYGPIVIDLVPANSTNVSANELESTKNKNMVQLMRPDSLQAMLVSLEKSDGENEKGRLLAVDLGIKTGAAVLDRNGTVLHVESNARQSFRDVSDLTKNLRERFVEPWNVTHMVMEGQDPKLYRAWKQASSDNRIRTARVVAEDWRRSFLTNKEQRNAKLAKDAASLIARQVLKRSHYNMATTNDNDNKKKMKLTNDAAEAILIGHYAVRAMGWVPDDPKGEPAVLRYTNGDIVR